LLPEEELAEIQHLARQEHLTVGEWVRRTLREARAQKPVKMRKRNSKRSGALRDTHSRAATSSK